MRTYPTNKTEQQDYAERELQLLCLIAQSLQRIEQHLRITGDTQPNKIIRFGGGRR